MGGLWFRNVGTVGIVLTIFLNSPVHGQEVKSVVRNLRRPADFYVSVTQSDARICAPVLTSLNKEYVLSETDAQGDTNINSDLLLHSDLQLPWQRRFLGVSLWTLDYAPILHSDGVATFLYRWSFYGTNRLQNEMMTSSAVPAELSSEKPISDDVGLQVLREVGGPKGDSVIAINRKTAPGLWSAGIAGPEDDTFIANAIPLKGQAPSGDRECNTS
jgi:hypothetical protein